MIVGDPVQLITRAGSYGDAPVVHGIVESIEGDRAQVTWTDNLTSSVRVQFLRVLQPTGPNRYAIRRIQDREAIRAAIVSANDLPRTLFVSADLHLRIDGHWPPPDDRPTMRPDELED